MCDEGRSAVFRKPIRRGAKRRRMVKHGRDPVLSPTGTRVLYVRDENGGSISRLLTVKRRSRLYRSIDLSSEGVSSLRDPAWQPRP
jgi:hypothetical protein